MRRITVAIIVMIMFIVFVIPAFATRSDDLQKRATELITQRKGIDNELLRIEGAFGELQRIIAEQAAEEKTELERIAAEKAAAKAEIEEANTKAAEALEVVAEPITE